MYAIILSFCRLLNGGRNFFARVDCMHAINVKKEFWEEGAMDVASGAVKDIMITPSGRVYSLSGLKRMLETILGKNCVDDPVQSCISTKGRSDQHGYERNRHRKK